MLAKDNDTHGLDMGEAMNVFVAMLMIVYIDSYLVRLAHIVFTKSPWQLCHAKGHVATQLGLKD